MNKINKISFAIISLALVFAISLGVATRLSYKEIDYKKAECMYSPENSKTVVEGLSVQGVLNSLEDYEYAFIVTVKESETSYETNKATALVKETIKGSNNYSGKEIVIYEPQYFLYKDESEQVLSLYTGVNNIMQKNKQYLVFANKINYAPEYESTLTADEFKLNSGFDSIYSFPIDGYSAEYISPKETIMYTDITGFDYICYSQEEAEKIEEIYNTVLNNYIN